MVKGLRDLSLTPADTNIYIIYNIELYWDGYIVQEQEYILKLNRNKNLFFCRGLQT